MLAKQTNTGKSKWASITFGTGLFISFFLSFVSWQGVPVKGYDMPLGNFFHVSSTKFGLENPFPQLSFVFYVFLLIPAGALISAVAVALNRKPGLIPFITGVLSLSLVTVFFLFTKQLVTLGIGKSAVSMFRPAAWVHALSAIGLLLFLPDSYSLLKKTIWIAVGPVFVFLSFLLTEKYIMNKTFDNTENIKADYTLTARNLLAEFMANDSAANNKYREKIIRVSGAADEVEVRSDSTVNIKFTDSTGSYIIFSLDKTQYSGAHLIKPGDDVTLKGSCSGSVYSDILGTTSISFKRTTFIKQ